MVRSTGSQPRVRVKVRGSKWRAAEAEDWGDREAFHRDREGGKAESQWRGNGEAGEAWGRPPVPAPRSQESGSS
jgi:hypothetical protein